MQDVSDKLLGQFVACLELRLGGGVAAEDVTPAAPEPAAPAASAAPAAPQVEAEPAAPAAAEPAAEPSPPTAVRGSDDALDLGKTVLPVVVKAYWKPVLAALVVIAVVVWLVTR
jgi:hypothetical protein